MSEAALTPAERYLAHEPEMIVDARAASLLKCSEKTVKAMLARGQLDGARFGRDWLITKDSIAAEIMRRISACRSATPARGSNGEASADASRSSGSSEARAAAARLALRTAEKLKTSSKSSSRTGTRAEVVKLRG